MTLQKGIAIIDYGSQYTFLITRRFRELGFYSEIVKEKPTDFECVGVVLSGGPDSVKEGDTLPSWTLDFPILGICYGMQLICSHLGGKLLSGQKREFGPANIFINKSSDVFLSGFSGEKRVWMSHGDHCESADDKFSLLSQSREGVSAIIKAQDTPWYGLQFHPEVDHSEDGSVILRNFAEKICGAPSEWSCANLVRDDILSQVTSSANVLMAVSGGVDSTVAAIALSRELGKEKVTPVFIDHGLLRDSEADWVVKNLGEAGLTNLVHLDRKDYFLNALEGVSDPEEKRKIIGRSFIECFEEYTETCGQTFTHLGQGTLYPDIIESAGVGDKAKVIKSHHNVGGLPDRLKLKLVEPFRRLFKDEVRALGRELDISDHLLMRHPFPGPGLAIRILGAVSTESVGLLQKADKIFVDELKSSGHYQSVWQAFVVLLPVKSVGVMGDNRTYERVAVLRAVAASDGMTADVSELPLSFLTGVSQKIVQNVNGINRVVYDITTKPPGTIEWE